MLLERGAKYGAELNLPAIPFINVHGVATRKLTEAGFSGVMVYTASDGKDYATGTWSKETQEVTTLPPQVVRVWLTE